MQRVIAEQDAKDAWQADLDRLAAEDEFSSKLIMARHAESVHVAMTGHNTDEWREAQQARVDRLAAAGFDASAPLGSPQHPETLIDGSSLTPNSAQAAAAQATRYATVSGIGAQLERNELERAAWQSDPAIRHQRDLSLSGQAERERVDQGRVISRNADPAGRPALAYQEIPPHIAARLPAGDW